MDKRFKIVIAPDSFKGSISAQDAAKAIDKGLINREYQNTLFNIIRSISIKSVGRLDPAFESMEWLSVYCTALHEAFYGREERMKEFCSRNGLVP